MVNTDRILDISTFGECGSIFKVTVGLMFLNITCSTLCPQYGDYHWNIMKFQNIVMFADGLAIKSILDTCVQIATIFMDL